MGFTFPQAIKASTFNAWLKEIEEPAYHENPLLAFARKRGLIKFKAGEIGDQLNWPVKFYRQDIQEIVGDEDDTTFNAPMPRVHAKMDWAGYKLGLKISKLTKLINQNSATRIYKVVETAVSDCVGDFYESLGIKMWQDGTITNTGWQGVLSLYGGSSTLTADGAYNGIGTYTPLTTANGDNWWACADTQTYGGLSCTLGAKVSTWTGDDDQAWPAGQFQEGYHAWTPIICDYNSRQFTPSGSSSTHSWDTQWQQAFNAVETYQSKICKVPVDLWIADADLVMRAKNSLIDNTRFVVTDTSEARSLGFPSINYNGWEILPGYGVPDGMACGFTFSKMEIRTLQSQLIARDDDSDIRTSSDLTKWDCWSQILFRSPKYFPCLVPASTSGT